MGSHLVKYYITSNLLSSSTYAFYTKSNKNKKNLIFTYLSTIQVFVLGGSSHTLLWLVFTDSQSKIYDSSQILPSRIFQDIVLWLSYIIAEN